MSYKVLLTEDIDESGKSFLSENGYQIKMGSGISEETVLREIADCDAVLTRNVIIGEKIMRAAPSLKVVSMHGVGVDNINVEAATRLGIQVTNAAGSNSLSVAEFTLGLMLNLSRNIPVYDRELRMGNWEIRKTMGIDLEGKTLGIVGMGSIGSLVAKKASLGFGMKVVGYRRHTAVSSPANVEITNDLERVLSTADFVSLHVPSTTSTRKMIGERELSLMKPGACLINTARGDVVDTAALVQALKDGHLAGAAVDVFEGEIPKSDNPLLHLPNVLVTPHAAAFTRESLSRMALYSAMGIHEVLSGQQPTRPVNRICFPGKDDTLIHCAS